KNTTSGINVEINKILSADDIVFYQQLVRKVPIADNVVEYAVNLVHKTRPGQTNASELSNQYLEWGAGPRASQFLVIAAKCNALLNGKYSPDIENIREVAKPILRHRIVRNFKAEAEGISVENIIDKLL
ncbi:MAG: MoxR family ATPase, partial [Bacteroidota bacterium]|nr:MoxR family ATPase [Bacteroidota bacterium]